MQAIQTPVFVDATPDQIDVQALSRLTKLATKIGVSIVDVAGFIDMIDAKSRAQLDLVGTAQTSANSVISSNKSMCASIENVSKRGKHALEGVEKSVDEMRLAGQQTQKVASWVGELEARMKQVSSKLNTVTESNSEITAIAKQVNILAVNAKIEAARAGDMGRGFAVVAEAINELSRKTADAADSISNNINELAGLVKDLRTESEDVSSDARMAIQNAHSTDASLTTIAQSIRVTAESAASVSSEANVVDEAIEGFKPAFDEIGSSVRETARGIDSARQQLNAMINTSEGIVQNSVKLGGITIEHAFIMYVKEQSARIGQLFEDGIAQNQITTEALFSAQYQPIAGSDPQQLMAPFTKFTDTVLPQVQEAALAFDPKVVFCAAVDTKGYLPTHNLKFSEPQRADPVWNASHSRNRRIFNDRVGLKAGGNTEPFLLQVYRRDLGGGEFALMKDLSAPIFVNGRHWGGLRLAYKI